MKTAKNLFNRIITFENLLCAAQQAAKGKRERIYVLSFFEKLEDQLFKLADELSTFRYKPGTYQTFTIYEPKRRMISAAPFRDRVVHHALINIIGPILEKSFIHDSYANRVDKGTHRAIRRYQSFLRQFDFALKCDIKKYFPSIDHTILKSLIRHRIQDKKTLWLVDKIIDNSNEQEFVCDYFSEDTLFTPLERRKGLPIGNLTSQYFANFYLDRFDHFIKEELGCRGYLRYVDDFVIFADSKKRLHEVKKRVVHFLDKLRLQLNPSRNMLYPCSVGTSFLGQVIHRSHRRLDGKNVRHLKKRLNAWQIQPPENLYQRIASWLGHAKQADTKELLKKLNLE
jgi:RNA-directed DNA polymerase